MALSVPLLVALLVAILAVASASSLKRFGIMRMDVEERAAYLREQDAWRHDFRRLERVPSSCFRPCACSRLGPRFLSIITFFVILNN